MRFQESEGGGDFPPSPRYNSNCTKERSSSTSQVPAMNAVSGWIWLWYKLICTRDWVESTQSETPEGPLQSERGTASYHFLGNGKIRSVALGVLYFSLVLPLRENPITRNLELTLPDKRGVGNLISWNNARFFEYTGTNAFSRIQKEPIPQDGFRAKTKRFPTYQDSSRKCLSVGGL